MLHESEFLIDMTWSFGRCRRSLNNNQQLLQISTGEEMSCYNDVHQKKTKMRLV